MTKRLNNKHSKHYNPFEEVTDIDDKLNDQETDPGDDDAGDEDEDDIDDGYEKMY